MMLPGFAGGDDLMKPPSVHGGRMRQRNAHTYGEVQIETKCS